MAHYTVILQVYGFFQGDVSDIFCRYHVEADDPMGAIKEAEQNYMADNEVEPEDIARQGGVHKVMRGLYVFPGCLVDVCPSDDDQKAAHSGGNADSVDRVKEEAE